MRREWLWKKRESGEKAERKLVEREQESKDSTSRNNLKQSSRLESEAESKESSAETEMSEGQKRRRKNGAVAARRRRRGSTTMVGEG